MPLPLRMHTQKAKKTQKLNARRQEWVGEGRGGIYKQSGRKKREGAEYGDKRGTRRDRLEAKLRKAIEGAETEAAHGRKTKKETQ